MKWLRRVIQRAKAVLLKCVHIKDPSHVGNFGRHPVAEVMWLKKLFHICKHLAVIPALQITCIWLGCSAWWSWWSHDKVLSTFVFYYSALTFNLLSLNSFFCFPFVLVIFFLHVSHLVMIEKNICWKALLLLLLLLLLMILC